MDQLLELWSWLASVWGATVAWLSPALLGAALAAFVAIGIGVLLSVMDSWGALVDDPLFAASVLLLWIIMTIGVGRAQVPVFREAADNVLYYFLDVFLRSLYSLLNPAGW